MCIVRRVNSGLIESVVCNVHGVVSGAELCKNGAQCAVDHGQPVGAPLCACTPGFEGEYCEREVNECLSGPCESGGVCVDHVDSYVCRCPRGFSGARCQHNNDDCSPRSDSVVYGSWIAFT